MNSLRSEISSLNKKQLQAQRTITHQDKIIDVLKEQVNCLQAEVLNVMRILADNEDTLKQKNNYESNMDVDVTKNSDGQDNMSCAELDWDREEDLVYKDILIFERDLVKRGKKELQDIKKNLKTRSNEETKTKIGNLEVEIKAKETELFTWVRKNENHKVQFDDDESLHTFFSQMDDLTRSCLEVQKLTSSFLTFSNS